MSGQHADIKETAHPGGSCLVTGAETLKPGYVRLKLKPANPREALPGQFAMVRTRDGTEPLLRRPFSIHRAHPLTGEFEILFRVAGKGTAILAKLNPGAELDVLYPLGRGFGPAGGRPLLVGGGIGVAPLLFLAEDLVRQGKSPKLLLGGRSDRDLLCHGDFQCLAIPASYATEDGTMGESGLVTALLGRELENAGESGRAAITVHACGPVPMLAAVARMAEGYGVPCEVSLEAHMACGVGACLGCIVKGAGNRNLRVCSEGPVFDSKSIAWD